MKPVEAILAAVLLAALAGCAARAKQPVAVTTPAPPASPPQPLSIPQTQVQLPRQQPFDPDALTTAPPPPAPAPQTTPLPASKPPQGPRQTHTTQAQPKPDPPPPQIETSRPPIQEIIPASEQQRLRHEAQDHRRQVLQLVGQAQRRGLTAAQQALVTQINQFIKSSEDAEKSGELRSAAELAARAHILAKELQGGR